MTGRYLIETFCIVNIIIPEIAEESDKFNRNILYYKFKIKKTKKLHSF